MDAAPLFEMDTAQEATTSANCYACIPLDMRMPVLISLFAQIAGMATQTPQQLVDAAACYSCIPWSMQFAVLINLAAQIASGGGGGGGGFVCVDANPIAPPTGTCEARYNRLNGTLWVWDNNLLLWVNLIA